MRALLVVGLVASSGLRVCGAEEEEDAPPPPPQVSAAADVDIAAELKEPRHGGEIVVVEDHVVEVVPTAEGEVYAYVAAHDGVVPPPDDVQLTVNVHVESGGVRPVRLEWNPDVLRFEGRVRGATPAPGPAEVLLVTDGRPRRARARHVVVVPRAKVKVVARGARPGARVWVDAPSGQVRVRGPRPSGKVRVDVRGRHWKHKKHRKHRKFKKHRKHRKHRRHRGRVEVRGPRPPSADVRVEVKGPKPPPPPSVRGEVRVEGRVGH